MDYLHSIWRRMTDGKPFEPILFEGGGYTPTKAGSGEHPPSESGTGNAPHVEAWRRRIKRAQRRQDERERERAAAEEYFGA